MRFGIVGFAFLLLVSSAVDASPEKLASVLAEAVAEGGEHVGFSLHVVTAEDSYGVASGMATPEGTLLTDGHMFRIASITKSYVAATVLRLVEIGTFDLKAPITTMIDPVFDEVLVSDGYDTSVITLKHVLSHTAGLYDHAQSKNFIDAIFAKPTHVWTRREQVSSGVEWGDPVGTPGEKFFYSDTGYVLLGHMIERATGKALPVAVRSLLQFEKNDLKETAWERGDALAVPEGKRVHQFMAGQDTYNWDPSVDLYGGGGLVASTRDVARYYSLLLGGKVFEDKATLSKMLSHNGLPEASPYRLGIFEQTYDGIHVYEHGGFWGTLVFYEPSSSVAIAGAALQQKDYPKLKKAMVNFLKSIK